MAITRQIPTAELTSFTLITLVPAFELEGQRLNEYQLAVLQNRRARIAEEIVHLTYTFGSESGENYGLNLVYLQGQLLAIQQTIDDSQAAIEVIKQLENPDASI